MLSCGWRGGGFQLCHLMVLTNRHMEACPEIGDLVVFWISKPPIILKWPSNEIHHTSSPQIPFERNWEHRTNKVIITCNMSSWSLLKMFLNMSEGWFPNVCKKPHTSCYIECFHVNVSTYPCERGGQILSSNGPRHLTREIVPYISQPIAWVSKTRII